MLKGVRPAVLLSHPFFAPLKEKPASFSAERSIAVSNEASLSSSYSTSALPNVQFNAAGPQRHTSRDTRPCFGNVRATHSGDDPNRDAHKHERQHDSSLSSYTTDAKRFALDKVARRLCSTCVTLPPYSKAPICPQTVMPIGETPTTVLSLNEGKLACEPRACFGKYRP